MRQLLTKLMVGGDVDEADARDIVICSTNGYF
jgi:hypothetical protein